MAGSAGNLMEAQRESVQIRTPVGNDQPIARGLLVCLSCGAHWCRNCRRVFPILGLQAAVTV